jgi:hypothetical protein
VAGVGDLVQRTDDGEAQVGYLVAKRSEGRVTLCAVCTVHKEKRSACFLVCPQNQGQRFVSSLASKLLGRVSRFWPQNQGQRFISSLASKLLGRVSRFWPQNWQVWFGDLDLKITMMISWFGPQNQAGFDLSVAPQN